MDWSLVFIIIVGIFFFILGAGCVITVILGLPGSWMMLGLAVLIELIDGWWLPEESTTTFAWWLIIVCGLLAGVGEVLEFIAGVLGAKKGGASKRGMWGALIGGILGVFLGVGIGLPIPIIGSVIGSLIGAAIGTFAGAIIGELSAPPTEVDGETTTATVRGSLKPATGATIGRVLGTLSKLPIAIIIWLVLTIAAFWP
ncbi:MAG: DUF456 domain-containing protein [Phycisphaerales bacterium]|nr:MAG: DUF456 domain-containing protein [Phycisphaerales bacterium]